MCVYSLLAQGPRRMVPTFGIPSPPGASTPYEPICSDIRAKMTMWICHSMVRGNKVKGNLGGDVNVREHTQEGGGGGLMSRNARKREISSLGGSGEPLSPPLLIQLTVTAAVRAQNGAGEACGLKGLSRAGGGAFVRAGVMITENGKRGVLYSFGRPASSL